MKTSLGAIALAMIGGSIAPALAESSVELAAPAPTASPAIDLPRFEPTADMHGEPLTMTQLAEPAAAEISEPTAVAMDIESPARDLGAGVASWYGREFAGRKTASGERFDPGEYTAAHRTLPFGSKVRVSRNGKSVIVRINDRGPFHGSRLIDLSQAAAADLGLVRAGSGRVELALLDS